LTLLVFRIGANDHYRAMTADETLAFVHSQQSRWNPVLADVHVDGNAYAGQAAIKQSQFGIRQVSAAGGTVKVKDELQIDFVIVPAR